MNATGIDPILFITVCRVHMASRLVNFHQMVRDNEVVLYTTWILLHDIYQVAMSVTILTSLLQFIGYKLFLHKIFSIIKKRI